MLSYTTLFGGTRTVELCDIESVRTEIGPQKLFGPFCRLVIEPASLSGKRPILINMKVFSAKDLQTLFGILGEKTKGNPQHSAFHAYKPR